MAALTVLLAARDHRHEDALAHAQFALQLLEAEEAPPTPSPDGATVTISLRAVAYHNISVQLEVSDRLLPLHRQRPAD